MKEKKEKIMLAAMTLMSKKGLAGLKVSDIAKEANIGKGTVYEYFNSKDEIFIESISYGISLCVDYIKKQTLHEEYDFKKSLFEYVKAFYSTIESNNFISYSSEFPFFLTKEIKKKIQVMLHEKLFEIIEVLKKVMQKGIEEGVIQPPFSPDIYFVFNNSIMTLAMLKTKGILTDDSIENTVYKTAIRLFN